MSSYFFNSGGLLRTLRGGLRSAFFRNMFVLMSGTAAAQLITVAVTPVLARFYDPSAFGVFGVYLSLVTIIGSVSTLRYDQALMLPKSLEDSASLFGLSCLSAAGVAVLSAGVCIPAADQIAGFMDSPELAGWLWLIPITAFLSGVYLSLTAWATRQKQFRAAASSQVVFSAVRSGSQCSLGVFQVGPVGLIAGFLGGQACACFTLGIRLWRRDSHALRGAAEFRRMKRMAREYADFPVYGGSQSLLNAISQNAPVLLLGHFFGMSVAGFYVMAHRLLQLPMNVVLTSLRQILFQKGNEVHNSGGDTYALFKKTTLGLLGVGLPPALAVILFAPLVFSLVLGEEWYTAGTYTRWLMVWLVVRFANVPAVLFASIYRKQAALWIQEISLMVCRLGAIVVGGLFLSALTTVILYSVVGFVFNLGIILWMWDVLRKMRPEVIR